jgi:hypothetical protein
VLWTIFCAQVFPDFARRQEAAGLTEGPITQADAVFASEKISSAAMSDARRIIQQLDERIAKRLQLQNPILTSH